MVRICRNRWKPDTCGCDVEFEFDDDLDIATRPNKLVRVYKACPAHPDLADYIGRTWVQEATVPFHQENQRKNRALEEMGTRLGIPEDENYFNNLQKYINGWHFDANRVLHISTKGLTVNQRNQVKSAVDTRFGNGKVMIE